MYHTKVQKSGIVISLLLSSIFAYSNELSGRSVTGEYLGGMIGAARISHDLPGNNTVSYGPYFSAIFGYNWAISNDDTFLLGAEISPAYSSQYYNADDNDISTDRSEVNIPIFLTGTYILDNGINLGLKGGLAFQTEFNSDSSSAFQNSGWHPVVAGKIGYYVKSNINLFAQYMYILNQSLFNDNNLSSNFVALGVIVNL